MLGFTLLLLCVGVITRGGGLLVAGVGVGVDVVAELLAVSMGLGDCTGLASDCAWGGPRT